VFVAMPLTGEFPKAFESVIEPAIRAVSVNDQPLKPRIVNRGTTGAPDIHEAIYDGILHSRVVVADLTVQASCEVDGATRWYPNPNVAYEVGLAAAWRNQEDILLIHQPHPSHRYTFDVQNLRPVEYVLGRRESVRQLAEEIRAAIDSSTFIARQAFERLAQGVSPVAVQFMYSEARRAFPVLSFKSPEPTGLVGLHTTAVTELLNVGALKGRHVQTNESGAPSIVYESTDVGLRLLLAWKAVDAGRYSEMRQQIKSVPKDEVPPQSLLSFRESNPPRHRSSRIRGSRRRQPEVLDVRLEAVLMMRNAAADLARRRALLTTALASTLLPWHHPAPALVPALRAWLGSWAGIGVVQAGMARQGYDLQLIRYDERGWRVTFYLTGTDHSASGAIGSAFEPTPWIAVQRAAWATLGAVEA
jgi:hypothetical protein